jgi:hypothetical protein
MAQCGIHFYSKILESLNTAEVSTGQSSPKQHAAIAFSPNVDERVEFNVGDSALV